MTLKAMKKITSIILVLVFLGTIVGYSQNNNPKDLFTKNKCNMCHSVSKAGIKSMMPTKYPDLPNKILMDTKIDDLIKFIKQETTMNGKKHGLKFKGNEEELKSILKWLKELK